MWGTWSICLKVQSIKIVLFILRKFDAPQVARLLLVSGLVLVKVNCVVPLLKAAESIALTSMIDRLCLVLPSSVDERNCSDVMTTRIQQMLIGSVCITPHKAYVHVDSVRQIRLKKLTWETHYRLCRCTVQSKNGTVVHICNKNCRGKIWWFKKKSSD